MWIDPQSLNVIVACATFVTAVAIIAKTADAIAQLFYADIVDDADVE